MENSRESKLWKEYKKTKGVHAKRALIETYIPLVKIIANKIISKVYQGFELDDLVQYGIIGLIDAIDKFDLEKNVKFESYASMRIRGEIIDSMRREDWAPRSIRKKQKNLTTTIHQLEEMTGRVPSDKEICEALGISEKEYLKLLEEINLLQLVSLDIQTQETCDTFNTMDSIEHTTEKKMVLNLLKKLISELSEREQHIIALYYFEELTFKEIGLILDISDSRVSQLHIRCVGKLRAMFERRGIFCPF